MIDVVVLDESGALVDPGAAGNSGDIGRLAQVEDLSCIVARTPTEVQENLDRLAAAILVVGPATPLETAAALLDATLSSNKEVEGILLSDKVTAQTLKAGIRAGFRDVVQDEAGELEESVRRVWSTLESRRATAVDGGLPNDFAAVPAPHGKIITFLGAKGGSGKTVLSTNTAVGLALQKKGRVILLDLDCPFGDVGVLLRLEPEPSLSDVMQVIDRLDPDLLSGFLSRHETGLEVLPAPAQRQFYERINPAQLQKLLQVARETADYVVVDTPSTFDETSLTILSNSDAIFLATMLDVPSIKDARIMLQSLKLLKYPDERIHVVLNRADSKVSLTPAEVQKHLQHRIAVQVPSDRSVVRSVNEGAPLLADHIKSPVVAALNELVRVASEVHPRSLGSIDSYASTIGGMAS